MLISEKKLSAYLHRSFIFAFILSGTGLIDTSSGQGLQPTPDEDYATIESYKPKEVMEIVVREVDGRPVYEARIVDGPLPSLPPSFSLEAVTPTPGRQSFSDCTAWAVAYCCLSTQNADSRGREGKAEAVDRFSPRFVYSLINRGQDNGSAIFRSDFNQPSAVGLLFNRGCATEATVAYLTGNAGWSVKPGQDGELEASHYKIIRHDRCESIDDIRYALLFGIPVVVATYTDAAFHALRAGDEYRWSGTKGGHHAMCVVGYDNNRRAFRIQNSWGTNWADNGRCWITYDYFRDLVGANRGNGWCYEAHAIVATEDNRTQHRYTVTPPGSYFFLPDGSIVNANTNNILKPAGTFEAAESTKDFLYCLRADGGIEGYVAGSGWFNITSHAFPRGFGGGKARMIGTTEKFLYAITEAGSVVVRIPRRYAPNNSSHWQKINLPNAERPIDLRIEGEQVWVASDDGDIFKWVPTQQPGAGSWVQER